MAEATCEQLFIPGLEPARVSTDVRLADRRQEVIEGLYWASGRSDPAHPLHDRYTGLWQQACLDVGRSALEALMESVAGGSESCLLTVARARRA